MSPVTNSSARREDGEEKNVLKDRRREERRLRNIESAKKSRERLKNESSWMQIQMNENEDRMKHLEKTVRDLTNELKSPPRHLRKSSASRKRVTEIEDRPSWFGEPY